LDSRGPRPEVVGGVEAAAELGQAPAAHLPGGELDRERQPVEAGAQLDDARVGRVPRHARFEPASAFDEQLGGEGAERLDRQEVFVADPEGFTAGCQHPPRAAVAERDVDQLGGRIDDVLTVVEHDERRPAGEVGAELRAGSGGVAFDAERIGRRPEHVAGGARRHEIDEHRWLGPALGVVSDSQCDGRLADAARSDQRDQPGLVELCHDPFDQLGAADQLRA
jgi:hypothetical protein